MKKNKIVQILGISAGIAVIASCATTKSVEKNTEEVVETEVQEESGRVKKEPKQISVQNVSNQQEKQFKDILNTLNLTVTSYPDPKRTTTFSGNAFKTPFTVVAQNDEGPLKDFSITASYPVGRANDSITYNTVVLKTDENGKATFAPEKAAIAVKDKITFYPTPVSSSPNIVQDAYNAGKSVPYVVKSKYTQWPGGILYVYDFNENGKPTTNNFTFLQTLRNAGINAGNAPVSSTSFYEKPISALYNECIKITGGEIKKSANFLVIGSFKYAEPAQESASGTKVTLIADITCVDMQTMAVLYKTTATESVTDSSKWAAEQKCRKTLAEKTADSIIYGM